MVFTGEAVSGRDKIMQAIIENTTFPVHSYGKCQNNSVYPEGLTVMEIFRQYKFCICMENSIATSYVSEKVRFSSENLDFIMFCDRSVREASSFDHLVT
jgi:hypothetical protein